METSKRDIVATKYIKTSHGQWICKHRQKVLGKYKQKEIDIEIMWLYKRPYIWFLIFLEQILSN